MSNWFLEGFDGYCASPYAVPPAASNVDFLRKWSSQTGGTVADWIHPGNARQQPGQGAKLTNAVTFVKNRPGAFTDTFIIGFAFQLSNVALAGTLLVFLDTTEQMSVRIDATGHLNLCKNSATPVVQSTNLLSANTWYYLEAKLKANNTTGLYEVRINGSSVGWVPAATNQNTRTTSNNQLTGFQLGSVGVMSFFVDDLYAFDALGSLNNDFAGPSIIWTAHPIGAGNYAQFTPNFGTNFGNVGEQYPDGDASFNQSSTAGHRDSFKFPEMPYVSGTITAFQHTLYAKQDAGAQRVIRPFQRQGGANQDGTSVNLTTSYLMVLEPHDDDPVTPGTRMTFANYNATEFGYNLVS